MCSSPSVPLLNVDLSTWCLLILVLDFSLMYLIKKHSVGRENHEFASVVQFRFSYYILNVLFSSLF